MTFYPIYTFKKAGNTTNYKTMGFKWFAGFFLSPAIYFPSIALQLIIYQIFISSNLICPNHYPQTKSLNRNENKNRLYPDCRVSL
jgi:hypothetical protein